MEEPGRYNQNATLDHGAPSDGYPPCGTIACLGGWVQVLGGKGRPRGFSAKTIERLLRVPRESVNRLIAYSWDESGWPREFRRAYNNAVSPKLRAKIAAERIEHFISTKGAE